ncbi:P-loop containing nucleoside triphosphate hydrolase protein [Nemania serpens]|nr:P-loop containing nucleoside triphosphate hydrolase protein [Nemania serpens]
MALTATATKNVITDMKHNLAISICQSFSQSFNRPNIYYAVLRKEKHNVETVAELINTTYSGKTGIVYALSRKSTETIAMKLQEFGIVARHYHASQRGNIKVVVATIAFGMGIDKPDVRFVIHQSLPKNGNQQQKARQGNLLEKVIGFCNNQTDCRRVEILRYFGESFPKAKCNASCDNCKASTILQMVDFTQYAIAALKLVQHHGKLTPTQCANILMGRKTKFDQKGLEMYHGIAKHVAKHDIYRVLSRPAADDTLKEENVIYRSSGIATQYLRLGPKAHSFLSGERRLALATTSKGESDQNTPSTVEKLPSRITAQPTERKVRFAAESELNDDQDDTGEVSKYFRKSTS